MRDSLRLLDGYTGCMVGCGWIVLKMRGEISGYESLDGWMVRWLDDWMIG